MTNAIFATMTMATSWGDEDFIWDNAFAYLDANEVGKCTTMSSLMNECAKRHFQQVPMTVQVVQHDSWGKARLEHPFDDNQGDNGVIYLSREKPFSQLYQMIASTLDLNDDESYAVEVIYHGLLVGQPSGCNSPTFSKIPEGLDDLPHVDVALNFAYLEWKYISRQIPIDDWIRDLPHTREAHLFAEDELKLVPNTYNPQLGAHESCHHWYHHACNHAKYEWFQDYTKPDSRPMRAYLELRMLEVNLRSTISIEYGFPTTLSERRKDHGHAPPHGKKFRWIPLYDFSGQVTYPGANEGAQYRPYPGPNERVQSHRNWGTTLPHFGRYIEWWDLSFPTTDET
jgi:hypothetical protein